MVETDNFTILTINNNTNIKLKIILIKKPITKIKINVIQRIKSNTKSNKMKSKSNHQIIKS